MTRARLVNVDLPEFGMPGAMPQIPTALYEARLERARARSTELGYDLLIVFADREHSANLSYLTGFDPRFEEAVLIVGETPEPAILVGNECYAMAGAAPLPMRRHLFQDLSLPGQPRGRSRPLRELLSDEGVRQGTRVGVLGWKTFADPGWLEVPAYLADAIRELVGSDGIALNANDLLIHPDGGLRTNNEIEQLATFEHAACHTSEGVKRLIRGLRPGMTEHEAVRLLEWDGTPLSCHLMLSAGERAQLGLLSPSDRHIERGDRFTTAFGVWGALNCRAGWVVEDSSELPDHVSDYVERLVGPYFEAIAEWYEALHVGQVGGALQDVIDRRLGDPFFGVALNPGHLLHLDEWLHSPVWPGSMVPLRSGMAMQVDVIPATGTEYFTTNIEDGIALADDALREAFASAYPEAWSRIEARRSFMREVLGIRLHPDVMPFSNIPAWLPPFLLRPERAMALA